MKVEIEGRDPVEVAQMIKWMADQGDAERSGRPTREELAANAKKSHDAASRASDLADSRLAQIKELKARIQAGEAKVHGLEEDVAVLTEALKREREAGLSVETRTVSDGTAREVASISFRQGKLEVELTLLPGHRELSLIVNGCRKDGGAPELYELSGESLDRWGDVFQWLAGQDPTADPRGLLAPRLPGDAS